MNTSEKLKPIKYYIFTNENSNLEKDILSPDPPVSLHPPIALDVPVNDRNINIYIHIYVYIYIFFTS